MTFEIQDRIPTKPNRKKLTFEGTNEVKYATVEWADEPTQEGSFLNREFFEGMLDYVFGTITAARIETGNYTGTGTYQENGACTLTFDFAPKVVIITCITARTNGWGIYMWGDELFNAHLSSTTVYLNNVTVQGNTMTWYNPNDSANCQLNAESLVYSYAAIGLKEE